MPLPAGTLTHRLVVQRPIESRGASGGVATTFEDFLEVWARPLSGKSAERYTGSQVISANSQLWEVRYRRTITATMRLKWIVDAGSPELARYFDIQGSPLPDELNERMALVTIERESAGWRQ